MILRHGLSENEIAVIDDLVKENGTSFAEEFRRILSGCDESKFSGKARIHLFTKLFLFLTRFCGLWIEWQKSIR